MRHVILLGILLLASCGDKPDPWRADAGQLLERTERLAQAGDLDAARGTLAELEKRGDAALLDRARTALARALLAANRSQDAAEQLRQVAWADKAPAVAGELVGLDLAIRWRGLFRAGSLVSGLIPAAESSDSDHGADGGEWLARQQAWTAWNGLLDGGVRMVEREGGRVAMPAGPGWLALARWAHGAAGWTETASALGSDPAVLLAAVQLHISEHDPERALAAAEELWRTSAAGSAVAFTALRTWQLRRRTLGGPRLPLWPFPAVDARLDAVAATYAAADAAAHAEVAAESDVGGAGLRQAVARQVQPQLESMEISDGEVQVQQTAPSLRAQPEWRLAFTHEGLSLEVESGVVAAGQAVHCRLRSDYLGTHHVALWRIDELSAWERLQRRPQREDLPAAPLLTRDLAPGERRLDLPDLAEGRWILALSARACPVVVLRSLRVAATALQVQVGVDGLLAWTVSRADGRGVVSPLRIDWDLVRDPLVAAGAAWTDGTPAWRAGFSEGFLGRPDPAWISAGAAADLAAGRDAGAKAAAADPACRLSQAASTGADGVLRLDLPRELLGRRWTVRVAVDRPNAHEAATAGWGEPAAWAVRAVCWADKPLVRPGETLRFSGILREYDGEHFRLPERRSIAELLVGGEAVWHGMLQPDARGMIAGSAPIPAGAIEGPVVLRLDGVAQQLAVCDRVALPPVLLQVAADGDSQLAGETRILRLRLSDAAGAALSATPIGVELTATASDRGEAIPVEAPQEVVTDLAGEAQLLIRTAAGREASWLVHLTVKRDGRTWGVYHVWSTTIFPFTVAAELDSAQAEVGGVLRVRLRLPAGAAVRLQAMRGSQALANPWPVTGGSDGAAEVVLALDERHAGADALRLSADVPGGGEVARLLALSVVAPPPAEGREAVACLPERTRLEPGDELAVTVGTSSPGRDVLLLAGSGAIIHHTSVRVETPVSRVLCRITPAWGPQTHLQAMAWLPGSGFTSSRRTALDVLPIDRLLRVTLRPDRAEPRPGDSVRVRISVRDWKDRPVSGAGLTLGAVDQRLYALAEDATPDLLGFFHHHARPWRLVAGETVDQGAVAGVLWRSVVWRWQGGDAGEVSGRGFDGTSCARGGGGRRRLVAASAIRALGTEADPTIVWLSGVVSDAQGEAEAVIELPRSAGSWRLTARAADSSAAVMVGEVRTVLTAARRLDLHLSGPRLARAGDRLVLQAEVANHGDATATVTLRFAGSDQQVVLDARVRRSLAVAVTVPEAAADAVVRRLGNHLGRIVRLSATIAPGTNEEVAVEHEVLLVPDGLPEHRDLQLVAGPDGRIQLPVDVPAGALVHAEVRAWPDLGARRDAELLRWRSREDASGAMAWLLAPAGAQRRAELARRWPDLDQSPAAQVVRLAAQRLGCGGGGMRELPDDAMGDWLRARARLAGLPLAAPLRHREPGTTLDQRLAIACTALAEGWGEGQRQWRALATEVGGSDQALVLALGLEASRLVGDTTAQHLLSARLATVAWDDPLVAVLAAELLPAAGPAMAVPLRLAGNAVEAAAGATWSGVLGEPLAISAPPGAVVALNLRWQPPMPLTDAADQAVGTITLSVREGDGFRALRLGEAAPPDQPMLLSVSIREGWRARLALPAGLYGVTRTVPARLLDEQGGWEWQLRDEDRLAAQNRALDWLAAPAGRVAALAAWDAALARAERRPARSQRQVELVTAEAEAGPLTLGAGQAIVVMASTDGEMRWSPVRFDRISDRLAGGWQILPPLRVATEDRPAAEPLVTGHPQRAALLAAAVDAESLVWLADQDRLWNGIASILEPRAGHSLGELLQHPACGRTGHWTATELRRWLDAEPRLDGFSAESLVILEASAQVLHLGWLVQQAAESREERREARAALQGPQAPPSREQAPIRGWFAAASKAGALPGSSWETWLWQQEMTAELLHELRYDATLDGWATFLRLECGLPITLGSGCNGGEAAPLGARLGTAALAARDLVLTRQTDGALLLSTSMPDYRASPAPLDLDWQDRDFAEALEAFNRLLANRGVPSLTVPPGWLEQGPPPISLRVTGMRWNHAAEYIAKLNGLELHGHELRRPAQP